MKKFLALALSLTMVLSLCACGEKGEATDKDSDKEASEVTIESFLEGLEKGQDVKLTVWGAEEDQNMLTEMIDAFKTEYADYANFEVELGVCSEATAKDTVLTDVEAAADVFAFADDQFNELVAAGALQAVSIDTNAIIEANGGVDAGSVGAASSNGTLYAYPMTADNGYFMFYNKAYFTEDDVKTLDKMMEVAATAGKKISMDYTSGWYTYSFFQGAGLEVGLNEDGVTNYCNWNATDTDITGLDVVEAMLAIANNDGFLSAIDAEFVTGLADGSIIAGVSGTWNAETAAEVWGDDYAATKLPTYTVAGQQVQMASFSGYKLLGVNAHSENVGWAMILAEWLTNYDNQVKRFETRNLGPSNVEAASSDAVQAAPAIAALAEQSQFATVQRIGGNFWTPTETFGGILAQNNPDGTDLQTLIDTCVEGIVAPVE